MIIGIGIDVVALDRFEGLINRQPTFLDRVLTSREQQHSDGTRRNIASLAGRFAAKEAVAKSLGAPAGLRWHDCEVLTDISGKPRLEISGSVSDFARSLQIIRWHISLTHDGGHAIAYVIAES
jgi:holo-[acyl-carrier protein] synthase